MHIIFYIPFLNFVINILKLLVSCYHFCQLKIHKKNCKYLLGRGWALLYLLFLFFWPKKRRDRGNCISEARLQTRWDLIIILRAQGTAERENIETWDTLSCSDKKKKRTQKESESGFYSHLFHTHSVTIYN